MTGKEKLQIVESFMGDAISFVDKVESHVSLNDDLSDNDTPYEVALIEGCRACMDEEGIDMETAIKTYYYGVFLLDGALGNKEEMESTLKFYRETPKTI